MTPRERFLAAIVRGKTDRPSIGTVTSIANTEAMDACGAAFPHVHLDAAGMAKLAAYVSIEAGFDMIFPVYSVIHEAAALGAEVDWGAKDVMPTIRRPAWKTAADITIPADFESRPSMQTILDAIRSLKKQYGSEYAIVGKAFGPWTLAYNMFGVENVLMMTIDDPDGLKAILAGTMKATMRSIIAQIDAGADTLCLADHCPRDMCSADTYREFLYPLHCEFAKAIDTPLVLHTCGSTADRLQDFAKTGLSCFHFDTRVPAGEARKLAGEKMALMGGVSNVHSLLRGDMGAIRKNVWDATEAKVDVIGPECALPLNTTMASLKSIRESLTDLIQ